MIYNGIQLKRKSYANQFKNKNIKLLIYTYVQTKLQIYMQKTYMYILTNIYCLYLKLNPIKNWHAENQDKSMVVFQNKNIWKFKVDFKRIWLPQFDLKTMSKNDIINIQKLWT